MGSTKISTIDLEEPVVEALNTIDTVADQITDMNTDVDSIKSTVESNATGIANNGTKLDTINTNTANINTRLTDTRASNLDLLSNSTYGLSALKTAIGKIPTSSGGGLVIGSFVGKISSDTGAKTFPYPVYVVGGNMSLNGTAIGSDGVSVAAGVSISNQYNDSAPCYVWKLVSS